MAIKQKVRYRPKMKVYIKAIVLSHGCTTFEGPNYWVKFSNKRFLINQKGLTK